MDSLLALAAPLALLLPSVLPGGDGADEERLQTGASAPRCEAAAAGETPVAYNPLAGLRESSIARQVRIEQRVIVRIAPQPSAVRHDMLAAMPQRLQSSRLEERGKEKCVPLDGIVGVQTGSGNRLVLHLRDHRMMSVALEKTCHARDFYAGFYVEKNKDGRLCVNRDKLQSRTGARCQVDTMRELIEVSS